MASVIFSNAQRIIAQIFDWLQSSSQDRIADLITDTFSAGIDNATSSGEGFLVVPGNNNTSATPSVNVTLGGIAYDKEGNRIFISPSDVTLYNPSNATQTTNDGLGNFLSTPQSSGVINIPMTQSSQNYIWIDYLPTINTAAFTLNEITNAKIFYEQTDGYNITVTTTNVAPDANSIFLANVNMLGGGAVAPSNISQLGRSYYNILPNIVPITTPFNNGSNRTPQYNQNTTYTLDAHIKSIGTGTGITPFNPHNMSLSDLGVTVLDTVVGRSQITDDNVIIAGTPSNPYPSVSAFAPSINIVNPGSDTLNIFAMLSTEFAIVNGTAYTTNQVFGAIPVNATILFPAASGFYYVYWDSVAMVFGVTTLNISSDATKLLIATVTYTYVGSSPSDHNALSGLTDLRIIGNSTTYALQRWTTAARPSNPYVGEIGFNITLNTLEFWDGSAWQQLVESSSNTVVPTGALLPFAGFSAPAGFLLANGGSYLTTAYPALFSIIGYTYGGSGGNFNVPNMVNNVPVGAGGSIAPTVGTTAGSTTAVGSDTVTPTANAHQHISGSGTGSGALWSGNPTSWPYGYAAVSSDVGQSGATFEGVASRDFVLTSPDAGTINPVTVNVTVSTVQPSIGVNYIIKT
jgi:microcystin-dependent protein